MTSKAISKAMSYEETGSKQLHDDDVIWSMAEKLGTPSLLWLLIKRHKVALLAIGNIVLVLNTVVPMWPNMLKSLLGL